MQLPHGANLCGDFSCFQIIVLRYNRKILGFLLESLRLMQYDKDRILHISEV